MGAAIAGPCRRRFLGTLLALGACLLLAAPARADDSFGPAIVSDRADYAPGERVTLTGSGWGIGESVRVVVTASDPAVPNPYEGDVLAGLGGGFTIEFDLPMLYVADYTVTASGESGALATTTFTDANVQFDVARVPASGTLNVAAGSATATTFTIGARKTGGGVDPVVTGVQLKNNPGSTCGSKKTDIPSAWLSITSPATPITLTSATTFTTFTIRVAPPGSAATGLYTGAIEFTTSAGGSQTFDLCLDVVNAAPVVAADNATVTVAEGLAAANTGTYSDANGNAVAITASVGTITKTGTSSGTWSWGFPTTDGPANSQTVTITANDGQGGVTTTTFDLGVTNTAPTATFNAPASVAEGSAIALSLTSPSDVAADLGSLQYAFDCGSGTFGALSSTSTASCPTSDQGTRTVRGKVRDKDGGETVYSATTTVTNVAPTVSSVTNDGPVAEGGSATVSVSASDPAGASDPLAYEFDCRDDGTFELGPQAASSASCSYDDNGSYTARARVSDGDGGSATGSTTVVVTNVAPTATLGNDGPVNEGSPVTVSFTGAADPSSADTAAGFHYAFSCTNGSLAGATYASSGTASSTSCSFADDGSFTIRGRIIDKDGGFTESTTVVTVTNVAPQVVAPANGTASEGSSETFDLGSFSDPGPDGPWGVSVDWGDSTSATTFTESTPGTIAAKAHTYADNGTYTVTVTVSEDGGTPSGSTTFTVAVSNAAPVIGSVVNDGPAAEGGSAVVSVSATDPAGASDPLSYEFDCRDDGTFELGPQAASSASCAYDDNGSYTARVRVSDDDGGSALGSTTVVVTNVAPTASLGNGGPVAEGSSVAVSFSGASDPSSVDTAAGFHYAFSCTNGSLAGATYAGSGTSAATSCTFADDGSFTVRGRIIDKDGGFTESTTVVTVTNVAPQVTAPSDQVASEGTSASFTLGSFFDPGDDGPWSVTVDWGDTTSPTTFTAAAPDALGPKSHTYADDDDYTVTVTVAEDGVTPPSGSATFEVTVGNLDPTIGSLTADSPIAEGGSSTATVGASDPAGANDPLSYEFDCRNDGSYEIGPQPTSTAGCAYTDNGTFTVKVRVTDGDGGEATRTVSVTVTNVDPTPSIVGAPSTSPEGTEIELDGSVEDPGTDDTFTYAWSVTKNGVPFGSGAVDDFAFTPDDNGSYVVTLVVTDDDGGSGSNSKTIAVTNVDPTASLDNDGPVDEGSPVDVSFSSPSDPSTADTAAGFHYAFSCTNSDLSGATYAGSGTSATTSCTFPDDGSFTVKGRIIDKDGGFTQSTTVVTVENVAPQVTAPSDQLASEGSATGFSLGSFSDPGDDDPWQVTVDWGDGTPSTVFTEAVAGSIGPKTHTYDDDGEYTVDVTVAEDGIAAPSGSASFDVTIANVAPTATPAFESPVDEGSSFTLKLTSPADVSAADTAAGFEFAFDCGDGAGYGSYSTASSTACATTDNGARSVKAKIKDKDDGEREYTDTVDVPNVAPTATLANDGPIGEGSFATVTFADQLDPSSADTSAGFHYAYACDGGDLSAATYATSETSASTTCPFGDDGSFTVKARIIDKDGGFAQLSTVVTVNNLPPSISNVENDGPVDEGSSATVSATASDPAGANDPLAYAFDCDGDATYELGPQAAASASCSFADDGAYTIGVRVTDDDGGSATSSTTVTVENVDPLVTRPADQTASEGTSKSFQLGSFADPGDDDPWHVTVDWGDETGNTTFTSSDTGPIDAKAHTYDDDDTYTVTVTVAEDGTSAPFGSATFDVTVENVAPTAAPDFETPVDEGSSFTLKLAAPNDASAADESAGFEYAFDCGDGAGYAAFAAAANRVCATTDNGSRQVKAKIRDKDGGTSEYTGSVAVSNVAPSATKSFDTTTTEGTSFALALTAPSDPSSADTTAGFTYAFDCGSGYGGFDGASSTTCTTNDNGTRAVGAKIRDKDGGEREYTGSVSVTNVDPTATLGNNGPKNEGSAVTVSFTAASDPSSADTAAGLHYAFSCTNGDLSGATYAGSAETPATSCTFGDNGSFTVKGRVIDKDGGYRQYTTSVTVQNVAPTGNAGGPYTGTWGNPVTFAGSATDPAGPNDTLTYAWDFDYTGTFVADQTGVALTAPSHTYPAPGTYTVKLRVSDEDGGVDTLRTATATIGKRAVTIAYTGAASGAYSDPVTVSATLTDNGGGSLQGTAVAGKAIGFTLGSQGASATTATGTGTASASITLNQAAGTPGVSATFAGDTLYTGPVSDSKPFTINREDASLAYSGDSLGLTGANLTLQATVTEAADSALGDVTKIWVRFEVRGGSGCSSLVATKYAQTVDSAPAGDGVGTATTTFAGSSDGTYCVTMSIVAGASAGTNGFYAGLAEETTVQFYDDVGRFVTGGGWVPDAGASGNGKGNFGFVGRFNKSGKPQGQMVYVYRGTFNGVPAVFRIKSNSLDALGFTGTTYPLSATLQGKANLQVVSALDGSQLYGEGNLSFVASVKDTDQSSGTGDTFSLTVTGGSYPKSIGATQLGGGNIVIHLK